MKPVVIWIALVIFFASSMYGQGRRRVERGTRGTLKVDPKSTQTLIEEKTQKIESKEYAEIFRSVERGIAEGNVGVFSQYFGSSIYVSVPGGENGYYSANQAYYILQNFFGGHRPQSFRFGTYGESDSAPYATGPGRFETRGSIENVQVYVAASRLGNRWVLSQVNIY